MPKFWLTCMAAALLGVSTAGAADRYVAPEGCTPIATLRLAQCVVAHFSKCAEGTIEDQFIDGQFIGRMNFTHPSMFVRYEGIDGLIVGHAYGEGVPGPETVLQPGDRFVYERRVFRSRGDDEAGDVGTEVMEVGDPIDIELDGKRYRVLDIRFEVTNPDTGYEYRERSLMLMDPKLTLGTIGTVIGEEDFANLPESISLEGDFGFLSMRPAASCGQGT